MISNIDTTTSLIISESVSSFSDTSEPVSSFNVISELISSFSDTFESVSSFNVISESVSSFNVIFELVSSFNESQERSKSIQNNQHDKNLIYHVNKSTKEKRLCISSDCVANILTVAHEHEQEHSDFEVTFEIISRS
jgi:hypothetical protein